MDWLYVGVNKSVYLHFLCLAVAAAYFLQIDQRRLGFSPFPPKLM